MNSFIDLVNRYGEIFVNHAQAIAVQLSVVIAIVWLLEWMLRRRVRASVRYALWMIVLVKLVLPTSLALPSGLGWWLRSQTEGESRQFVVQTRSEPMTAPNTSTTSVAMSVASVPSTSPVSFHAWVMFGSAGVSCLLLAYLMFRWRAVHRMVEASHDPEGLFNELLNNATQSAALKTPVALRLTDKAIPPAVCGLFRPVILLPVSVAEKLDAVQIKAVLLHECLHVRRGDPWVNCFQTLAQIVLWWHPLLWVANARIRDIREEAVDDAVVAAMNTAPEFYASTLLEVAAHAFDKPLASLGLLGIMESQSGLRHRIQRLVTSRRPRIVGLTLLSLLLIIGIGALLIPLGSGPFDYPPSVGNPNPVTQLQPATPIQNNGTKSNGGANPIPAVAVDTNSMRSSSGVQIQVEAKFYEVSLSNLTPGDTNNPFLQVIGKTEADRSVSSETRTLLELPQTMRADLVSSQPRSCVLTDQQFRTWIRWVELGSGNDILSAPPFSFVEGQTGKFQLLEDIAIATGIDTNAVKKHIEGSNSNLYTTETIKGGPHIIMRANTTENHDISLFVAAHIVEFKGFGTPTKADQIILKSDAGESMRLTNPKPYCRVIEMSAQGALTNGQTLLVGGPTNMSTRVTKDKVPVLGDVPIIGRLFRSEQTNHNTTQMFITLTAVVKDGGNATAAEKH